MPAFPSLTESGPCGPRSQGAGSRGTRGACESSGTRHPSSRDVTPYARVAHESGLIAPWDRGPLGRMLSGPAVPRVPATASLQSKTFAQTPYSNVCATIFHKRRPPGPVSSSGTTSNHAASRLAPSRPPRSPPMLSLLLIAALTTPAAITPIPDVVPAAVPDVQEAQVPDRVQLEGMIGARIEASTVNRLLEMDVDRLLEGYRKRPGRQTWDGEHVGKWLHAASLAWANSGDERLHAKIAKAVAELVACQQEDGYLGTYLPAQRWTEWDVWAHKYNLIGLITWMRVSGDRSALPCCRAMADLLCRDFGDGKRDLNGAGPHKGMAPGSVLEPMVWIYRFTGEERYGDFCRYVLRAWETPTGPHIVSRLVAGRGVDQVGNAKAYEMLSCIDGLLEWYRVTGDKDLLTAGRERVGRHRRQAPLHHRHGELEGALPRGLQPAEHQQRRRDLRHRHLAAVQRPPAAPDRQGALRRRARAHRLQPAARRAAAGRPRLGLLRADGGHQALHLDPRRPVLPVERTARLRADPDLRDHHRRRGRGGEPRGRRAGAPAPRRRRRGRRDHRHRLPRRAHRRHRDRGRAARRLQRAPARPGVVPHGDPRPRREGAARRARARWLRRGPPHLDRHRAPAADPAADAARGDRRPRQPEQGRDLLRPAGPRRRRGARSARLGPAAARHHGGRGPRHHSHAGQRAVQGLGARRDLPHHHPRRHHAARPVRDGRHRRRRRARTPAPTSTPATACGCPSPGPRAPTATCWPMAARAARAAATSPARSSTAAWSSPGTGRRRTRTGSWSRCRRPSPSPGSTSPTA